MLRKGLLPRTPLLAALFAGSAGLVTSPVALAVPSTDGTAVDWTTTVLLDTAPSTGGIVNPGVLVGFNPQPEPPGDAFYPPDPVFPTPDQALFTVDADGLDAATTTFRVLLAIGNGTPLSFGALGAPDDDGSRHLDVLDAAGALVFEMILGLTTDSGGIPDPGSLVGFNPQPEPPAVGAGAAAFGFDFNFTSLSEAYLSVQVLDANGNALTFTGVSSVPEPGTLALAGLALIALTGVRRIRSR